MFSDAQADEKKTGSEILWILACFPSGLLAWQRLDALNEDSLLAPFFFLYSMGAAWAILLFISYGAKPKTWGKVQGRKAAYSVFVPIMVVCTAVATMNIYLAPRAYPAEKMWTYVAVSTLLLACGACALWKWPRKIGLDV